MGSRRPYPAVRGRTETHVGPKFGTKENKEAYRESPRLLTLRFGHLGYVKRRKGMGQGSTVGGWRGSKSPRTCVRVRCEIEAQG